MNVEQEQKQIIATQPLAIISFQNFREVGCNMMDDVGKLKGLQFLSGRGKTFLLHKRSHPILKMT